MNKTEFINNAAKQIREFLPSDIAQDIEIEPIQIVKMNDQKPNGLRFHRSDDSPQPTIYLDQAYENLCNGESAEHIFRKDAVRSIKRKKDIIDVKKRKDILLRSRNINKAAHSPKIKTPSEAQKISRIKRNAALKNAGKRAAAKSQAKAFSTVRKTKKCQKSCGYGS